MFIQWQNLNKFYNYLFKIPIKFYETYFYLTYSKIQLWGIIEVIE